MLPHPTWLSLAVVALPVMLAAAGAGAATTDPLAVHRGKDRVLLAVADIADDPRLERQRIIFHDMGAAAQERDLRLVVVVGATPEATALRRQFGVGAGFHVLLIGKDGGAKLSATAPLQPEALLPLIDAMPMRQEEMQKRS